MTAQEKAAEWRDPAASKKTSSRSHLSTTSSPAQGGVSRLLDRLDRVRSTGPGRWIACCPSHTDKSPSLSVRQLDDGRVLIHCFAECPTESVLAAINLTFSDLSPARLSDHHTRPLRQPFPAGDILRCIGFESIVVVLAACDMANGKPLSELSKDRLLVAAGRVLAAMEVSGHA